MINICTSLLYCWGVINLRQDHLCEVLWIQVMALQNYLQFLEELEPVFFPELLLLLLEFELLFELFAL